MFKEFNKREAKKYGKEIYKKWRKKLTKSEIKSIKRYKRSSKKINCDARAATPNLDVDNISKALEKSIVGKDIIVYRESHIKFLQSNNTTMDKVSIGDKLIETGFMSTFLYRPKWAFKGKVRLKIYVPARTQGAYINQISNLYKWECEILFNRNMVLEVKDKYWEKNRVVLEVLCIDDKLI